MIQQKKKDFGEKREKDYGQKKIGMYKNNNNIKMERGLDENLTMIILKLFFFSLSNLFVKKKSHMR
jgi:hypothetical protein